MNEHKKLFQETEASLYSASGVALAGIFLIFSKQSIDQYLQAAFILFSGAMPLLVGLAMLSTLIYQETSEHDKWWSSLQKNELYMVFSLAPYIAILVGVGLIIYHVSNLAAYAYSGCSLISIFVFSYLYESGKSKISNESKEQDS